MIEKFLKIMGNIIWGILGILASLALVKWRRQIVDFFGTWAWAEKNIGSGGTYTAVVILAIALFFLAITKMSGHLDGMVAGKITKFF